MASSTRWLQVALLRSLLSRLRLTLKLKVPQIETPSRAFMRVRPSSLVHISCCRTFATWIACSGGVS